MNNIKRTPVFTCCHLLAAIFILVQSDEQVYAQGGTGLDRGLILWYPFCGNAKDESGNDRHGTVSGATLTKDRFGKPDRAYRMTLGDSSITSPFNFDKADQPRSFSMWFKPEKWDPNPPGYFQGLAGTGNVDLIYGVNPALKIWNNGTAGLDGPFQNAVFTGSTLKEGEWYHIALTYAGRIDTIKVWINGQPMKHMTEGFLFYGGSKPFKTHEAKVSIPGTECSVDELRVYNRVLSESEVQQLSNQRSGSDPQGCSSDRTENNTGREPSMGRLNFGGRGGMAGAAQITGIGSTETSQGETKLPSPSLWSQNGGQGQNTQTLLPISPRGQRIVVRGNGSPATSPAPNQAPQQGSPLLEPTNLGEGEFAPEEGRPSR